MILLATVSHAPYCLGGVRQATGESIATRLSGNVVIGDVHSRPSTSASGTVAKPVA